MKKLDKNKLTIASYLNDKKIDPFAFTRFLKEMSNKDISMLELVKKVNEQNFCWGQIRCANEDFLKKELGISITDVINIFCGTQRIEKNLSFIDASRFHVSHIDSSKRFCVDYGFICSPDDTGTFVNPGDEFIETMDEVIDIHVDNETPYVIGGSNLSNDWERTVQQLYP